LYGDAQFLLFVVTGKAEREAKAAKRTVYRSVSIPLSVCHDDTSFAQGRLRLKCTPIPQDLTYHSPAVLTTAATACSYWQYHDTSDVTCLLLTNGQVGVAVTVFQKH